MVDGRATIGDNESKLKVNKKKRFERNIVKKQDCNVYLFLSRCFGRCSLWIIFLFDNPRVCKCQKIFWQTDSLVKYVIKIIIEYVI